MGGIGLVILLCAWVIIHIQLMEDCSCPVGFSGISDTLAEWMEGCLSWNCQWEHCKENATVFQYLSLKAANITPRTLKYYPKKSLNILVLFHLLKHLLSLPFQETNTYTPCSMREVSKALEFIFKNHRHTLCHLCSHFLCDLLTSWDAFPAVLSLKYQSRIIY